MLTKILIKIPRSMDADDARLLLAEVEGLCEDYGANCISDAEDE